MKHIILTGGTDTARSIAKAIPATPLSAETGGKNVIILTASGDRDHTIMNIVISVFGNAGQKCSACSLLVERSVYEDKNFQKVSSKGSMDAYFAFPRIREGQTVAFYDLSRLSYESSLDSINLMNLLKTIKHADDPMQSLILNLSKPVKVNVDNFSFIHNGKETKFQGQSSVSFNSVTKKPENVYLKLFAKSPVDFVDEWVDSQYKVGLEDYLKTGAISSDGSNYSTVLELNGNKITLNGVDINSDIKSDESDEKSVKKDLTIDLDSL